MVANFWGIKQTRPVQSFVRTSVAYKDGVLHGANTKREKKFALVSQTDGAIPAAAGVGSEHIKVMCKNSTYIFGTGVTSARIYRSSDGATWARTSSASTDNVQLFCLSNGTLLSFKSDRTMAYSTDNGDTLVTGTFDTTRTSTSVIATWSLTQHASTIMLCEYGTASALGGKYLYRSTDNGATWTKVADLDDQASHPYHWHTVAYHDKSGRWVAFFGDTLALRGCMFSVDDGVTWSNLHYPGNYMDQPVHTMDVGDDTRLFAAFDGPTCFGWVNVFNGEIEGTNTPIDPRTIKNYCFALGSYNGIYYAGGFDNSTTYNKTLCTISDNGDGKVRLTKSAGDFAGTVDGMIVACTFSATYTSGGYAVLAHDGTDHAYIDIDLSYSSAVPTATVIGTLSEATIWVSTDLVNWSVFHKFIFTEGVLGVQHVVGGFGGKMHFLLQTFHAGTYRPFTATPAVVKNVTGVIIEPATTNLANTPALSSFETASTWVAGSVRTTIERFKLGFVGDYSTRIAGTTDADVMSILGASPYMTLGDAGAEKKYVIQFRAKATRPIYATIKLYRQTGTVYVDATSDSVILIDKNWRWFRSYPFTCAAGTNGNHRADLVCTQGTKACELFVDAFQIHEVPISEWQIGGTAKTPDILTETVTTGVAFTDLFAVQTLGMREAYAAGADPYIKSWIVGSDALTLYYDVSEAKFYLQRNSETAVASGVQYWHPNQIIRFALRADGSGITLNIQNGRANEHLHDSALAALLSANMTMVYGNGVSTNQFPGVYYDGTMDPNPEDGVGFIPFLLSDIEIEKAFNMTPIVQVVA